MAISAKDVMELRKQTDCGMMECKKALTEADGNFEKAIEILRERGLATAAKKASRVAAEGMVYADYCPECKVGVVIEVNAETDFVAKNDKFVAFVKEATKVIMKQNPADVEALMACKTESGETVDEASVPAEVGAKEKEIMLAQMAGDPKNANKPDAVQQKMIEGKNKKYFKENCLVDQEFVKDGDMTVGQYTAKVAKDLGGDIKVIKFTHFVKGEGLEKRSDDFAAEVASMVK